MTQGSSQSEEAKQRCAALMRRLPPVEGSQKYARSWNIEAALEQHQNLMRMHELQTELGQNRIAVRRSQISFAKLEAQDALAALRALSASPQRTSETLAAAVKRAQQATEALKIAERLLGIEEAKMKSVSMEGDIEASNQEMVALRQAINDVSKGNGSEPRKYKYCTDCRVGGHGQRFCKYLLKRPDWKVYPYEKWFEDKNGATSHCPLGKRSVDFTDETYFSRIAMHIKGRIWLEDKWKLWELVPEYMPPTFVIKDQKWIGEPPEDEKDDSNLAPWFVKATDRNWGTSIHLCQRPQECMALAQAGETYVVQKHIPKPLLYNNGEKLHIKFYNLLVGRKDGVTWDLYTYKSGYLCISPVPWSPTNITKEAQVTIIRTQKIDDWPIFPISYPKCQATVGAVITRLVEMGKLEGRDKVQFEIFSSDFVIDEDHNVLMLEFNMGPVLKDPEDSPNVHDAEMIMGALHIVEPWDQGDNDQWDLACSCQGKPPEVAKPPEASSLGIGKLTSQEEGG